VTSPRVMALAWKCETDANEGGPPWYRSPESMRYCFLTKIPARDTARAAAKAVDPRARQR
jgi:predicted metal-binding protein